MHNSCVSSGVDLLPQPGRSAVDVLPGRLHADSANTTTDEWLVVAAGCAERVTIGHNFLRLLPLLFRLCYGRQETTIKFTLLTPR